MLARLAKVSQLQAGDAQPELEFMVIRVAIDLPGELVPCSLEVAQPHGREPAVEEMKRRVGLDPPHLSCKTPYSATRPCFSSASARLDRAWAFPGSRSRT